MPPRCWVKYVRYGLKWAKLSIPNKNPVVSTIGIKKQLIKYGFDAKRRCDSDGEGVLKACWDAIFNFKCHFWALIKFRFRKHSIVAQSSVYLKYLPLASPPVANYHRINSLNIPFNLMLSRCKTYILAKVDRSHRFACKIRWFGVCVCASSKQNWISDELVSLIIDSHVYHLISHFEYNFSCTLRTKFGEIFTVSIYLRRAFIHPTSARPNEV